MVRSVSGIWGVEGARRRSNAGPASRFMTAAAVLVTIPALLLGACAKRVVSSSTSFPGAAAVPTMDSNSPALTGSATAQGAIDDFLAAVKAQDLQKMSAVWGNSSGLARDQFSRDETEKRLIVMQCVMQHDSYTYPEGRGRIGLGGRQEFVVELKNGDSKARTTFTTVQGPKGRWLLENVDVTPLRNFCR